MCDRLYGKTILWNGDSICAGTLQCGAWADIIASHHAMVYKNYAVGGGTIADKLPLAKSGERRHSVCRTLVQMYAEYPDADYIILEGGTNDADLLGNALENPETTKLGSFSPDDFSGCYDTATFCGALEDIFCRATRYWTGKKIGYVVAQKMGMCAESFRNRRLYFDVAVKICQKWGIPYIDLWNGCYLNPWLPWMYDSTKTAQENKDENRSYYLDGQHLTDRGYALTAELLENWLQRL